ncbi:MAG: single-stranded DNA-binding protein [Microbacteriaceae bacterium]|nr:single-stranded DNA-binding protein [Microbacteriaceae bacterium]
MTDTITLSGLVATAPRHLVTSEGLPITSFRLASTQRRFDRSQERWVDGDTNWYTITAFRQLAMNVAGCVVKGDRVIATGRLRIREWSTGEKAGTTIEVDADAIGPDLTWGTAPFTRSISAAIAGESAAEQRPESEQHPEAEQSMAAEAAEVMDETAAFGAEAERSLPVPF